MEQNKTMKPYIHIDKNGVAKHIPDLPEEPNRKHYGLGNAKQFFRAMKSYREALAAAKESAIEYADQTQVISVLNVQFGGECGLDVLLPLPEGWKVEIKYRMALGGGDVLPISFSEYERCKRRGDSKV